MEKIILNIWYSNKIFYRLVSYILFPISLLYILIFYLFRTFKTELKISVPILCVGNINVGGTGKTSTLLEIIKYFKNKEKNICVLLKGYGGKKHTFKKVSPNDSATLVGDEAMLFSNHVPTYISTNRILAVTKILNSAAFFIKVGSFNCAYLNLSHASDALEIYSLIKISLSLYKELATIFSILPTSA